MLLRDFFDRVYVLERPIEPSTIRQYRLTIRLFDEWHGRPLRLCELTDGLLNRWIIANGSAPKTIKRRRTELMSIWRYAWRLGLTKKGPERIRTVKAPAPIPKAWTLEEIHSLLAACELVPGRYGTIPKSLFWKTLIRLVYDTGLRRSDVLSLTWEDVDLGGSSVIQHKTKNVQAIAFNESTRCLLARVQELGALSPAHWPLSPGTFSCHWRRIVDLAGFETGRMQGVQKLRRSSGTYVELHFPGMGSRHLGHKTPGLAERHYIDARIVRSRATLPPALD